MKAWFLAVLVLLSTAATPSARAGSCAGAESTSEPATFISCARDATAQYRDQAVAVRDGYRRIGGDFPAMGEHWIRITLVFDGHFDPARPEILTYATVQGRPQLMGVAYALPLLAGEVPPQGPGGIASWHDHAGTIDEETVLVDHQHRAPASGDLPRLAMMHAWVWIDNPDGTFAPDNWAVPFVRLGLTPPDGGRPQAARALSLLSGGADYFLKVIAAVAPGAETNALVNGALDEARRAAGTIVADEHARLSVDQLAALDRVWRGLWTAIDRGSTEDVRSRLAHLSIR